MTAKHLKGTYNLNPTSMVMKQGSEQARYETTKHKEDYKAPKSYKREEAHEVAADLEGVEHAVHSHAHPAMQTRIGHARNAKHSDGRRHEDHHHAVKMAKGKM